MKYYPLQAQKLRDEEKVTMFIDFTHLLQFQFDERGGFIFVNSVVKEYTRFEPFLRKAVTQFMTDKGHPAPKGRQY